MINLVRHPDAPPGAIHAVEARIERLDCGLAATFVAHGDIDRLVVPASSGAGRADGLWRTTCFELFVGGPGPSYREFNLSPSGLWAAYRFDDVRAGMRPAEADALIRTELDSRRLMLVADLACDVPPLVPIGMTAVIEETDGAIRYWATSFEPGKPDFHAPGVRSLLLGEVEAE